MARRYPPLRERLYSRLAPCADPGCGCDCRLWTGSISQNGYGRISADGRGRKVHQVAWELENGPVPDGLVLDHVRERGCRHRHCANVAHLEPVTNRENLLRGEGFGAVNAAKESCPADHEYNEINTYTYPGGRRSCRICQRLRQRVA